MPASPGCSVRSSSSSCRLRVRSSARSGTGCWAGRSSATKCRASVRSSRVGDLRRGSPRSPSRSARSAARPATARAASTARGSPAGSRGPTATRSAPRRSRTARSCPGRAAAGWTRHRSRSGRDVEQVELTGEERLPRPTAAAAESWRRVEEPGPHPQRAQRVDLVLHQRDQRRDDHADAVPDQRRDLVAQRLAAAGRHQHQGVAAADDVLDDLALLAAERVVPEDPAQDIESFAGQFVGQRVRCFRHPAILGSSWRPNRPKPLTRPHTFRYSTDSPRDRAR